jgi:hypothetical protein
MEELLFGFLSIQEIKLKFYKEILMKNITITDKLNKSLTYIVEDANVDSFISKIPALGFGRAESTITTKDIDGNDIVEIVSAEFTYVIVDLSTDPEYLLQVCYKNRRREYGDIGSQLDEQFHNYDAWKARIAAIKAKYPKS